MAATAIQTLAPFARQIMDEATLAAGSSLLGRTRESMAIHQFLEQAYRRYPHSDLVAHLATALLNRATPETLLAEDFSLDDVLAPFTDGPDLRQFLYDLADCQIKAAGTGLLSTGRRVTPREADYLTILKTRLGL